MKPSMMRSLPVIAVFALALAGCASDSGSRRSAPAAQEAPPAQHPQPHATATPARVVEVPAATAGRAVMFYPTGDQATSVLAIEKIGPAEVQIGQPFDYEIRITNLSRLGLDGVTARDRVPAEMRVNGAEPRPESMNAGEIFWRLGSLRPGETRTIRINAVAAAVGNLVYCVSVDYETALCIQTAVIEPKLQIVKQAPAEVLVCDPIPVRIVVTNAGTGAARNVRVTDALPAGLVTADGRQSIELDAGILGPGESREFTIPCRATRPGQYENRASATADGGLSADSNPTVTIARVPVLEIAKTCPEMTYQGRPVNYQITVRNTGDGPARDTVLEDILPAGAAFLRASDGGALAGNRIVWNLGTLAPQDTRTVTCTVTATAMGILANRANVAAYCAEARSAACDTQVKGIAAILLEVVDLEDPVEVGAQTTYVITATNQGSEPDSNIRIVCQLEAAAQFVSCGGATPGTASGSTITFQPLATLAPGAKAEWRVVIRAVEAGDSRFAVEMNTDQLQRPVNETEATNLYR